MVLPSRSEAERLDKLDRSRPALMARYLSQAKIATDALEDEVTEHFAHRHRETRSLRKT